MKVEIDKYSGFCFGVVHAIQMAELELEKDGHLYCLGDIVHNEKEVERLASLGLQVISHQELKKYSDCKVLIRAHGEPPETYKIALENNIELLDASCPVVLKLQHHIKEGSRNINDLDGQIVVYGKKDHAEIIGLVGQIQDAVLISDIDDLEKIDYNKPIYIYSQTTKSPEDYNQIIKEIEERRMMMGVHDPLKFVVHDTLCRQVSGREPALKEFASQYDVIVFVSGNKSSNGKTLYGTCKKTNDNSYFISDIDQIQDEWFKEASSVGICGATSTPLWLMEEVLDVISKINQ